MLYHIPILLLYQVLVDAGDLPKEVDTGLHFVEVGEIQTRPWVAHSYDCPLNLLIEVDSNFTVADAVVHVN